MRMKKRYFMIVSCLLCLTVVLLAGCGNKNTAQTPNTANPQGTTTPAENNNSQANNAANQDNNAAGTNTPDNGEDMSAMNERADKIAQAIVDGVEDVENAHVLISEHMAYVAVQIKDSDPTGEAEAVKEAVIKKAKEADQDLDDVYVSESADVFARMGEIGQDITEGKPISGFIEELENLFVRVTPSK